MPGDLSDDLFDVSKASSSLCLFEFCRAVKDAFGIIYLRQSTPDDLKILNENFAGVGFPACIDCLDCASWKWKNCPKALQGATIGKDGTPTL